MHNNAPQAAIDILEKIASFGYAIQSSSSASTAATTTQLAQALPDFPCDNLKLIAKMIESNPTMSATNAIHRLYPYETFLPNGNHLATLFDALKISQRNDHHNRQRIAGIELQKSSPSSATVATVVADRQHATTELANGIRVWHSMRLQKFLRIFRFNSLIFDFVSHTVNIELDDSNVISIPIQSGSGHGGGGAGTSSNYNGQRKFVETNYHNNLLAEMVQSYAISDVCLVGPRGSGKSMLVSEIARLLQMTCEPMVLYQDMTTRDFLQQRTTTASGNTVWRDSALVRAAKSGSIAILDGIHRIHSSTISILHR